MFDMETDAAALEALTTLDAAVSAVAGLDLEALSNRERLDVLRRLAVVARRLPAIGNVLISLLCRDRSRADFGGQRTKNVLVSELLIAPADAQRRLHDAAELTSQISITGEPVAPRRPNVAAAQDDGAIGREHTAIVHEFFNYLSDQVPAEKRETAEEMLARAARTMAPDQFRKYAQHLAAVLKPDGEPDDADCARRSRFHLGAQGADLMTRGDFCLDPELRAYLEAIFAKLAAPGMCNPDDETPVVDGEADRDARDRDPRTQAQRNHDALKAVCRAMLSSGDLGRHRGLPVTVVATTTVTELENQAGVVTTGGGSRLPMRDLIRMAGEACHYLAVFDRHIERALYLGRAKRCATGDQRIVLYAKDRGCMFPGCSAPAYWTQVHHRKDWAADGFTDVDNETLLCDHHHTLVTKGIWRTARDARGRTVFIAPPDLDQRPRINLFHHPEDVDHEGRGTT